MKLQIDQIDTFDIWLSETEHRIARDLDALKETQEGIDEQYQDLAQLQDELVAKQQITEYLQNMIIVIEDSTSTNDEFSSLRYNSNEIESKLLSLSERWANICNFVQNRWIELQEIKILFEQIDINQKKIEQWLTSTENQIQLDIDHDNTDTLMQQVHYIQV